MSTPTSIRTSADSAHWSWLAGGNELADESFYPAADVVGVLHPGARCVGLARRCAVQSGRDRGLGLDAEPGPPVRLRFPTSGLGRRSERSAELPAVEIEVLRRVVVD